MKRILSMSLKILGVLSLLVVAAILLFGAVFSGGNTYEISNTTISPSGKHYASLYTGMGGGAAGWCRIGVIIYPAKSFEDSEEELIKQWSVIDGRCSEEFKFKWGNSENLKITSSSVKVPEGVSIHVSK
jgi:hypothetical protein